MDLTVKLLLLMNLFI